MIKYQESKDQIGYTEFIDDRGLTPKSNKRRSIHENIEKVTKLIAADLEMLGVRLYTNSTTIVSNSLYQDIDQIIEHTYKMWAEVQYPFLEQIYIRTSTFENRYEFSLPSTFVPKYEPKKAASEIAAKMDSLNNPDQILLHPRLSEESLKKKLTVGRFRSYFGTIDGEIGFGNIRDVKELNSADEQYAVYVGEEMKFELTAGNATKSKVYINKILKAVKLILPYLEEYIAPDGIKHKPLVYEFQILDSGDVTYFIFTEIESV